MEWNEYLGRALAALGRDVDADELTSLRIRYASCVPVDDAVDAIRNRSPLDPDRLALTIGICNTLLLERELLEPELRQIEHPEYSRQLLVRLGALIIAGIERLDRANAGAQRRNDSEEEFMQVSFASEGKPRDVRADVETQAAKQKKEANGATVAATDAVVGAIGAYVDTLPPETDVTISVTFGVYHKNPEAVTA